MKRLKELANENQRLRRAVSDLTLEKLILTEAAKGKIVNEEWRHHYNTVRPHSALGWKPLAPETIVPMDQRPVMH